MDSKGDSNCSLEGGGSNKESGPYPEPGCVNCHMSQFNLCEIGAVGKMTGQISRRESIAQSGATVDKRRSVSIERGSAIIVCRGWAAYVRAFSNGHRPIISFHLPGEIVWVPNSPEADGRPIVEAVSFLHVRIFRVGQLIERMLKEQGLFISICSSLFQQAARAEKTIISLGRLSSEERVARLLLDLAARNGLRDVKQADPVAMEFPLRQRHIAAAIGMTQSHVTKVMSQLREARVIDFHGGVLKILEPALLYDLANKP